MKAGNLFKSFKPDAEQDKRIMEVNENPGKYTWTANLCMLSHHHPRYNKTACLAEGEVDTDPDENEHAETTGVTNKTLSAAMLSLGLGEKKEPKPLAKGPASGQKKFGEYTDEFRNAAAHAQRFMR